MPRAESSASGEDSLDLVNVHNVTVLVQTDLLLLGGGLDRVLGREDLVKFLELRTTMLALVDHLVKGTEKCI